MTKKLFLIDYECAHWCGGSSNVVVWAETGDEAIILASDHMEEAMRELFSSEYDDWDEDAPDGGTYDESAVAINFVEEFGPEHEQWGYFQMPSQSEFYPVIGEQD